MFGKFSPHYQDPLGKTSGQNHLGTVYSLDIWVVVSVTVTKTQSSQHEAIMPSKMFTIHLSKSLPLQQKPALQCHSWILLEQHCIKKSVNTFSCINYITIVALKLKILTCHLTPLWDVSPPETTNKFESMWRVIYLTRRNCSFYSCFFFTLLVHNITVPPQRHHLSSVHSVRWQLLHSSPLTCASDWKTFISSRLEWRKFCFMPKYINELNIFLYAHFSEHWQDGWLFPTVSGNPGTCWRLYKRKKNILKITFA